MTTEWIDSLQREYEVTHPSDTSDRRSMMERVGAELERVAKELSKKFPNQRFRFHEIDDHTLAVDAPGARSRWTAARLTFNEQDSTVMSDPTATVARVPGDHRVFTYDPRSGEFSEKDEIVTVEELVTRALNMFVKSVLGLGEA
jgi:hypothetical protein